MKLRSVIALAALALAANSAFAVVSSNQTDNNPAASNFVDDGIISVNEYSAVYNNGGGSGFGGTLGAGSLYMDADNTNLYLGFQPGNNLNDNVVIHLDTKAGGFTDAQMNDTADPGRNLLTNLTRDVDDPFPNSPDYGIVIGQFGEVSFELGTGSLNFISFQNDQTGNNPALAREFAIPLAAIGNPSTVDFFVTYGSDTNFMSNESLPADAYNAGGNPGFDNNGTNLPVAHTTSNQFNIPEPGSLALLGLSATGLFRRRR